MNKKTLQINVLIIYFLFFENFIHYDYVTFLYFISPIPPFCFLILKLMSCWDHLVLLLFFMADFLRLDNL